MAAAHTPHRLEATQRVAQHLQHVAHDDRRRTRRPRPGRARRRSGREDRAASRAARPRARSSARGAARVASTAQPSRRRSGGPGRPGRWRRPRSAAPLDLERPEAVHRADVEAAHAGERRRPRQPFRRGPKIQDAGRDDARRDLDRVPPIELSDARPRSVSAPSSSFPTGPALLLRLGHPAEGPAGSAEPLVGGRDTSRFGLLQSDRRPPARRRPRRGPRSRARRPRIPAQRETTSPS